MHMYIELNVNYVFDNHIFDIIRWNVEVISCGIHPKQRPLPGFLLPQCAPTFRQYEVAGSCEFLLLASQLPSFLSVSLAE